jgi:FkbM family methyltransferase
MLERRTHNSRVLGASPSGPTSIYYVGASEIPSNVVVYPGGKAYRDIQDDVASGFHLQLRRERDAVRCIVIVGAYHGIEIHGLLNSYPNANIFAFEAHPSHFRQLQANYQGASRVQVYNACIGDVCKPITFHELSAPGCGSIYEFQGDKFGHEFCIVEKLAMEMKMLADFPEIFHSGNIDLLWVDVQGAELNVLKGIALDKIDAMFLEIKTHDHLQPWDAEPYIGQCFLPDLVAYAEPTHVLVSVGLDNEYHNGSGNSFWRHKRFSGV